MISCPAVRSIVALRIHDVKLTRRKYGAAAQICPLPLAEPDGHSRNKLCQQLKPAPNLPGLVDVQLVKKFAPGLLQVCAWELWYRSGLQPPLWAARRGLVAMIGSSLHLRCGFRWTSFHSLSCPTLGMWPREAFYLPDPCELTFASTLSLMQHLEDAKAKHARKTTRHATFRISS